MRYFEATSKIEASPDAVWAILVDGTTWKDWDSGVEGVEGEIAPGNTIKIRSQAAPGRTFPVKVSGFEPPRRLTFSGGMPLGLFKGVRTYALTPEDGTTTFHMREEYVGPLAPLVWRSIPDLSPSFNRFAEGLKRRVESSG